MFQIINKYLALTYYLLIITIILLDEKKQHVYLFIYYTCIFFFLLLTFKNCDGNNIYGEKQKTTPQYLQLMPLGLPFFLH